MQHLPCSGHILPAASAEHTATLQITNAEGQKSARTSSFSEHWPHDLFVDKGMLTQCVFAVSLAGLTSMD